MDLNNLVRVWVQHQAELGALQEEDHQREVSQAEGGPQQGAHQGQQEELTEGGEELGPCLQELQVRLL